MDLSGGCINLLHSIKECAGELMCLRLVTHLLIEWGSDWGVDRELVVK
jgi:hypothetical protein